MQPPFGAVVFYGPMSAGRCGPPGGLNGGGGELIGPPGGAAASGEGPSGPGCCACAFCWRTRFASVTKPFRNLISSGVSWSSPSGVVLPATLSKAGPGAGPPGGAPGRRLPGPGVTGGLIAMSDLLAPYSQQFFQCALVGVADQLSRNGHRGGGPEAAIHR